MQTLYDLGMEIAKIREAINGLTVKGSENAALVIYAVNRCNDLIKALNEFVNQQHNPPDGQNGEDENVDPGTEEGDTDGEPDRGAAS